MPTRRETSPPETVGSLRHPAVVKREETEIEVDSGEAETNHPHQASLATTTNQGTRNTISQTRAKVTTASPRTRNA